MFSANSFIVRRILPLVALAVLLGGVLTLGFHGINRSLWLDEAWVANSMRAPSLAEMFQNPEWLQTSPPLFLLAGRAAIAIFGLSTLTFRGLTLLFALLSAAGMLVAGRKLVTAPLTGSLALMGACLLAFHTTAVENFRAFKQYGAEAAATVLLLLAAIYYLQAETARDSRIRFWMLTAAILMLMPLSYPLMFVVPGVVLAVALRKGSASGSADAFRTGLLAGISLTMGAALYVLMIAPNRTASLETYWSLDDAISFNSAWGNTGWIAGLFSVISLTHIAIRLFRRSPIRNPHAMECMLAAPILTLGLAELLGIYPPSVRTHLFIRPCVILLALVHLDRAWIWCGSKLPRLTIQPAKGIAATTVIAFALIFMAQSIRNEYNSDWNNPREDYDAAVTFLDRNLTPGDTLVVHASVRQGLSLYSAIHGWNPNLRARVVYGSTGWPCCPRGIDVAPGSSDETVIAADLDRMLGPVPRGRIWLLYTDRLLHWTYTGFDEGLYSTEYLASKGCRLHPPANVLSLVLVPLDCP